MEDSIFTKIVRGEIPSHKVYEDESTLAFMDIAPFAEGQLLVIPKQQVDHLWDVEDELYQHLMVVTKRVAQRLREVYKPERVLMIVEGFEVPHVHIKLIPTDRGVAATLAQKLLAPTSEELAAVAKRLAF